MYRKHTGVADAELIYGVQNRVKGVRNSVRTDMQNIPIDTISVDLTVNFYHR